VCNRYGYQHPYSRLVAEFSDLGPVLWDRLEPNAPRDEIRPTDSAPIIRTADGGVELVERRWGMVPWFHKKSMAEWKGLNTNARSETVSTLATFKDPYARRRCLVPATHFFEWTADPGDPNGRKLMWRFTVPAQPVFAFPGLWDVARTADGPIESFTLLTSAPGPDAAPYHNRQPVILRRDQWAQWLDPANDIAAGFTGSPAGTMAVERALRGPSG
jgi:putative SOS response-associated peptidase YedK